ncbi:hypothetical protein ACSBR1_030317 [Camellia fascicularis]
MSKKLSGKFRLQEVVIFTVGGTTYEESRSVTLQNATNSGIRFILGGSMVLNSKRSVCEPHCAFYIDKIQRG